jgi:hypothetical protein
MELGIRCRRCGHLATVSSARLRALANANWAEPIESVIRRIRPRLRCEACGLRDAMIASREDGVSAALPAHEQPQQPKAVRSNQPRRLPVTVDTKAFERQEKLVRRARLIAVIVGLVYMSGCGVLNEAVRRACTHGNCVHGWYSKDTRTEQDFYWMWAVGFPVLIYTVRNKLWPDN